MATHCCPKCGGTVGDSAVTCPKCGSKEHAIHRPQLRCAVCGELVAATDRTNTVDRWGNSKWAHKSCVDGLLALPSNLRRCDCAKPLTTTDRRGSYDQIECSRCHGNNKLPTQGVCGACLVAIFAWQTLAAVSNPQPERYMPDTFPCHDVCRTALEDKLQRRKPATQPPRPGFWRRFWG